MRRRERGGKEKGDNKPMLNWMNSRGRIVEEEEMNEWDDKMATNEKKKFYC